MGRVYDRRAWRRSKPHGRACHWCGRPAVVWDHLVPLVYGGAPLDARNLVPSCVPCNSERGQAVARARRAGIGRPSRSW